MNNTSATLVIDSPVLEAIPFPAPNTVTATITGEEDRDRHAFHKPPVQPLADLETIQRAREYFLNKPCRYSDLYLRDYAIFVVGINLGRRYGDLRMLQVQDVVDATGHIKDRVVIKESKTGKIADLPLNNNAKEALLLFLNTKQHIDMHDFLFQNYKTKQPLTTKGFYRVMQRMKLELDIEYPIGTHTMRKTNVSQMMLNAPNLGVSMAQAEYVVSKFVLGHCSMDQTNRYLALSQAMKDSFILQNNL